MNGTGKVICFVGGSGSGKTTLMRRASAQCGQPVIEPIWESEVYAADLARFAFENQVAALQATEEIWQVLSRRVDQLTLTDASPMRNQLHSEVLYDAGFLTSAQFGALTGIHRRIIAVCRRAPVTYVHLLCSAEVAEQRRSARNPTGVDLRVEAMNRLVHLRHQECATQMLEDEGNAGEHRFVRTDVCIEQSMTALLEILDACGPPTRQLAGVTGLTDGS